MLLDIKQSQADLLSRLQEEIHSNGIKEKYRKSEKDFTRNRVLTFSCLVYQQLNLMNKSMSVELHKFLGRFGGESVSKQAFSKAIRKIKWEGFAHFNDFFVKDFYQTQDYQRFKNRYLLVATDGTTFELPYTAELVTHFGQFDNGQMKHPICLASSVKLYDVLNNITICSSLSPYELEQNKGNSEKALFEGRLKELKNLISPSEHEMILIGDKYYPSFEYFCTLPEARLNFVFRCTSTFCKEVKAFAQSGEKQAVLTINLKESKRKYKTTARNLPLDVTQVQVRCLRIDSAKTEPMFLLTNMQQEDLSIQELGQIYYYRWGEETSFRVDKDLLEMENFNTKSVNGVLQSFYAKTLTCNIAALVIQQAQQKLDIEQQDKDNKHDYKINQAVAIGLIKDEIVLFLSGQQSAQLWFDRMVELVLRHRSPIRPNRSFTKKRKHKLKFSMNLRRVT